MSEPSSEELHADPAHWKLGIFYVCRQDPRVIVPKRIRGLGWTINLARPSAYVWILFVALFAWSTIALARYAGAGRDTILIIKLLLATAILVFCYRAANAPPARK